MHSMRVDPGKNCLYLTFGAAEGVAERREFQKFLEDVREGLLTLSPGFACVTDLREFRKTGRASEKVILQIQKELKAAGLAFVIRIERRQAIFEHLQFETGSMEAGYPTYLVRTPEEAEKILEKFRTE